MGLPLRSPGLSSPWPLASPLGRRSSSLCCCLPSPGSHVPPPPPAQLVGCLGRRSAPPARAFLLGAWPHPPLSCEWAARPPGAWLCTRAGTGPPRGMASLLGLRLPKTGLRGNLSIPDGAPPRGLGSFAPPGLGALLTLGGRGVCRDIAWWPAPPARSEPLEVGSFPCVGRACSMRFVGPRALSLSFPFKKTTAGSNSIAASPAPPRPAGPKPYDLRVRAAAALPGRLVLGGRLRGTPHGGPPPPAPPPRPRPASTTSRSLDACLPRGVDAPRPHLFSAQERREPAQD